MYPGRQGSNTPFRMLIGTLHLLMPFPLPPLLKAVIKHYGKPTLIPAKCCIHKSFVDNEPSQQHQEDKGGGHPTTTTSNAGNRGAIFCHHQKPFLFPTPCSVGLQCRPNVPQMKCPNFTYPLWSPSFLSPYLHTYSHNTMVFQAEGGGIFRLGFWAGGCGNP